MTETRGRALLISNKFQQPNGSYREGSEHDYRNMKAVLVRAGFVTTGSHQNYDAQVIIEQSMFRLSYKIVSSI